MIQKNNKYDEIRQNIQQICNNLLGFYVQNIPLSKTNFPLLELTYTLWRKCAYNHLLKQKNKNGDNQHLSNFQMKIFHSLSQKKYLPAFVQRVQNQMNVYSRGLRDITQGVKQLDQVPKQQQQIYQIIVNLGKCVWQQQLYLQLIQDLIKLPYLPVISAKSSITPRHEYATDYIFRREKTSKLTNIASNAGKSIFNKALSALTETVFSKTFIIKINTLFGSFNPLVMGATFGLSRYLQYLDKKNKQDKLQIQLKRALELAQNKAKQVKKVYIDCLQRIQLIMSQLQHGENQKKYKQQLKKLYLTIYQEQWLKIQVVGEQDGWQVVHFQQKQSFQQI